MTGFPCAKALAGKGFSVFPIAKEAKFPPLWAGWPARATTVPAEPDWPAGSNTGIHCKGLLVLDVDPRSGGGESLVRLDLENELPQTLTANTPSGGLHMFYQLPKGHTGVPNSVSALGPGIDVKSTRGYVVGAGSTTAQGTYAWRNALPVADAPQWLIDRLGVASKPGKQGAAVPAAPPEAVARARDYLQTRPTGHEAFKTALGLRDFGLSAGQALSVLSEHDGRSPDILGVKVHNAYRYGSGEAGSKMVTADSFEPVMVPAPKPSARAKAVRLGDFAQSQTSGPGYAVKGLLQAASYAELYGAPGAGKTFVALDVAYHVAAGIPWMERRVHQGLALYLAYEGTGGLVARAKALRQHYGSKDVPLFVVAADFNLRETAGRQALGAVIAELPAKPSLIVIDTFARALMGGDENSAQDVGAFNSAVQALIESTGACVLILHHTGKDASKGARGSSALLGALDTEIHITSGCVSPTKQRDIELGAPIGFSLESIPVDVDDDGDMITSCVVMPAAIRAATGGELRGNQRSGWDVLCQLSTNNEPVPMQTWHDACRDEFLGDKNCKKRFYDVRTRLVSMGLVQLGVGKQTVTRRLE